MRHAVRAQIQQNIAKVSCKSVELADFLCKSPALWAGLADLWKKLGMKPSMESGMKPNMKSVCGDGV